MSRPVNEEGHPRADQQLAKGTRDARFEDGYDAEFDKKPIGPFRWNHEWGCYEYKKREMRVRWSESVLDADWCDVYTAFVEDDSWLNTIEHKVKTL